MNFVRLLQSGCSQLRITQQRQVSQYAKKFGYKMKSNYAPESRIKPLNIAACFTITGYVIYDITRDRREHLETFLENYKEGQKYYDGHRAMEFTSKVDMSFLLDKYDPKPTGEEDDIVQNKLAQPLRNNDDKKLDIDTKERLPW